MHRLIENPLVVLQLLMFKFLKTLNSPKFIYFIFLQLKVLKKKTKIRYYEILIKIKFLLINNFRR